jgi:hypothetical protein
MEKSSQIAWNLVPLRHLFPLKVVPLIEVLLYILILICYRCDCYLVHVESVAQGLGLDYYWDLM